VIPAIVPGKKDQKSATTLVQEVKDRSDETIPFFTSDERSDFRTALLEVFGEEEVPEYKGVGRPPKPRKIPPPELKYARVKKYRKKGRVVKMETNVVFGTEDDVREILEKSPVSNQINISFVERQNLNFRQGNARCQRKTQKFSKIQEMFILQLWIFLAYYHFVRPHWSLRLACQEGQRRWKQRTPLMAEGITDHVWSFRELLTYVVPPVIQNENHINRSGT
jgi:hypothetical protein